MIFIRVSDDKLKNDKFYYSLSKCSIFVLITKKLCIKLYFCYNNSNKIRKGETFDKKEISILDTSNFDHY